MNVFENLGEDKAKQIYNNLIKQGLSEEDAFNETYSSECCLDED